jgi:hypothetical protein
MDFSESQMIGGFTGGADAAKDGFYPKDQLARAERFRDVIIGSQFKAHYTIHLFGFRREHNHGDLRSLGILLQDLTDFQATHFREHQVQNDQRRQRIPRLLNSGDTIFRLEHREAGSL